MLILGAGMRSLGTFLILRSANPSKESESSAKADPHDSVGVDLNKKHFAKVHEEEEEYEKAETDA
jgi:hypothetical protein